METFKWSSVILAYGSSFILGILMAPLIYADAMKLPKLFLNTKPWFWSACTIFLGPLWVTFVYWAIHHSSFSNRKSIVEE